MEGPIDRGVGPQLHPVLQDHAPQLGYLDPLPGGILGKPKTLGPDHRAGLDEAVRPDLHPVQEGRLGLDQAAGADLDPGPQIGQGVDHGPLADL